MEEEIVPDWSVQGLLSSAQLQPFGQGRVPLGFAFDMFSLPKAKITPSEQTFSRTGEGFTDLERQLHSTAKHTQIELRINWEVPQAMELYRKGTRFSSILTISGKEIDAQTATCEIYLSKHFQNAGKTLLDAVQAAWESEERSYDVILTKGNLHKLSVHLKHLEGSEHQLAIITASGTSSTLTEVARAFTWFCCAIRPARSDTVCLSTFQFYLYTKRDQPTVVEVQPLPLRDVGSDHRSCWYNLFKKDIFVLDAPIYDRSRFGQSEGNRREGSDLSVPKGLEIPFNIMIDLAAINYPFEYESGIVLKGFSTLLVATAKWETHSGTAFQWHFVNSEKDISLSEYTDDEKYHIWGGQGESDSLELETVRKARTFLGWCDSYLLQLTDVDPSQVEVTTLEKAGRSLVLKTIGVNAALGKSAVTAGANATFKVQKCTVMHSRETEFHEMITRSITTPVLLYAPEEGRGWLLPQLSVLESMALINIKKCGSSDKLPPADLDLEDTRTKLLKHLQDPTLIRIIRDGDEVKSKTNTFRFYSLP